MAASAARIAKPTGPRVSPVRRRRKKVTPFLMFSARLEDAIDFYTSTFPDAEVLQSARAGEEGPVQSAEFVVGGQKFKAFEGGPHFSFSEGFSLFLDCVDQVVSCVPCFQTRRVHRQLAQRQRCHCRRLRPP